MARDKVATERTALMKEADRALTDLTPLEEFVLRLRFGVGGRRQTLDAIARRLGVKREDLGQLEARALSHLRRNAAAPEVDEEGAGDWRLGAG